MESLRIVPSDTVSAQLPCCRCNKTGRAWDQIANKAYCPNCQEMLVLGEAEPLVERTEKNHCAICNKLGTIAYITFPLQSELPLLMDLCPEHLRALLGRRLGPYAFNQVSRRLRDMGIAVNELFLLHGAFYDNDGTALQPAIEPI